LQPWFDFATPTDIAVANSLCSLLQLQFTIHHFKFKLNAAPASLYHISTTSITIHLFLPANKPANPKQPTRNILHRETTITSLPNQPPQLTFTTMAPPCPPVCQPVLPSIPTTKPTASLLQTQTTMAPSIFYPDHGITTPPSLTTKTETQSQITAASFTSSSQTINHQLTNQPGQSIQLPKPHFCITNHLQPILTASNPIH
jgi:hypothetical protein